MLAAQSTLALALALAVSLVWSAPIESEVYASSQLTVPDATLIYNSSGWIEFIRPRANGQILVPYTSKPELWELNPITGQARLLVNFTGPFIGFTGITEVQHDYFALLSGNFSIPSFELGTGSWGVWTVDFRGRGNSPPLTKFITQIPNSRFFLGATPLDTHNIFIADGGQGLLYKVNLVTGDYNIVLQDASMDRNGGLAGIHGVQYDAPYVYYSNTYRGGYFRLQVTASGVPVGSPELISPLDPEDRLEGFASWKDGSTYVGIQAGGIKKVQPDGTYSSFVSVQPPTDCVFGRTPHDEGILYISTPTGTIYKSHQV